jgi:hypothetical protein
MFVSGWIAVSYAVSYIVLFASVLLLASALYYCNRRVKLWEERATEALAHLALVAHCPDEVVGPARIYARTYLETRGVQVQLVAEPVTKEADDAALPVM